jgi:DNA-binding PadR family transcriptional regulator
MSNLEASQMSNSLGKLPQGAPRGLLIYWMLHRIARSPTHGYEILTEIDQKTEGAWRPGPGSIYPLLKKLVSKGYVEAEQSESGRPDQRRYRITPKGLQRVKDSKEMFRMIGDRSARMRGVFLDLIGPEELAGYVVEGTRKQFELAMEVVESNQSKLSKSELQYLLREYSLILERQQDWTSKFLKTIAPVTRTTQKRRSA